MKITFKLNGTERTIETAADRRVIDVLREDLGLTGAKEGCGTGECGACTILVNGESRLSCLMLAAQLDAADIVTIEGGARVPLVTDIQGAFVEHGAVQCGFCTPGMVLGAVDFLSRHADPDRKTIRDGISGNLCRCTGYQKIVDAVEAVVSTRHGDKDGEGR